MRQLLALTAILALAPMPARIGAQQVAPASSVEVRRADNARALPITQPIRHLVVADSAQPHPWRWIGPGAAVGVAAGGVVAAVTVSRTDDGFFGGQAIGLAAVAGGVVGGLVGVLFT